MERVLLDVAAAAQHDFGWEISPHTFPGEVCASCMLRGNTWFSRLRGSIGRAIPGDIWPLPEAIAKAFAQEQRFQNSVFELFQVLEVHAPGDATVELAFCDEVTYYRVPISGPHIVRVLVRKNFPADSLSTILFVPVSSTLKSLSTAITVAPGEDVTITQVYALPLIEDPSLLELGRFAMQWDAWMQCTVLSLARSLSEDHYLVLTLKKCASGSPLLPQSTDAVVRNNKDWTRLSYEEFELTSYLKSFLQTIGAPVMAFDQIAGQRLAPYMSAVTRDAWSQHYPRIQTWLKTAGLAYKIHTGSSSGPKIIEAIKPRFVEPCMPVSGYTRPLQDIQASSTGASSSSFSGSFAVNEFSRHFRI